MFKNLFLVSSTAVIFLLPSFSQNRESAITARIDSLVQQLYRREQFNGSILVSINEKPVYKNALGKSDLANNTAFNLSTPCYLASVSKQFTAAGILLLLQKKLVALDDPINKYFTNFPDGDSITIKQLLNHTSGIVNYEDLGIDKPGLTNQMMYESMVAHEKLQFRSGEKYEYSNTGYVLLAMIIEKVSKMSFAEYMNKYVFGPLKMNHTFFYYDSLKEKQTVCKAYGKFGEESDAITKTTGDGGICSTAEDLYIWDKAMYSGRVISPAVLAQSFEPAILKDGSTAPYGLGWMIKNDSSAKIVYHTGGSGGYRTYMERDLTHHNAIIILTNMENSPRREISQAIENILNGKSYDLPKISIATKMYGIHNQYGIDSAMHFYNNNKINNARSYDFSEQELNLLGYKLWSKNIDETIQIFTLNTNTFPASSNAWESLGEAWLQKGDKEKAASCFNASLKFNATNQDAIRMLQKMK